MNIDEEYFKSEEFQDILERYEASINAGSTPFMDADDFVDVADYYGWQEDDDRAEEAIHYALELYPSSTLPNVFMARRALAQDDIAEAEFYANAIENRDALRCLYTTGIFISETSAHFQIICSDRADGECFLIS